MAKERAQYINSVNTCSLCSIMPIQYVATTDANRPEKKDHLLACYKNLHYRSYMKQ